MCVSSNNCIWPGLVFGSVVVLLLEKSGLGRLGRLPWYEASLSAVRYCSTFNSFMLERKRVRMALLEQVF